MKFHRVKMLEACGALQAGHFYNLPRGQADDYIQHGKAESTEQATVETPIAPPEIVAAPPEIKQEPKKEPAKPKLKLMPKKAEHKTPAKKTAPRKRA
jgi:hypothetical protein